MLLEFRADLSLQRDDGQTALLNACYTGVLPVVRFLLVNRANVNDGCNRQQTPVMVACHDGHKALVELLLSHKASVVAEDSHGHGAFDYLRESADDGTIHRMLMQALHAGTD